MPARRHQFRRICLASAIGATVALSACAQIERETRFTDPKMDLTKDNYRYLSAPPPGAVANEPPAERIARPAPPPIPEMYPANAGGPPGFPNKTVSLQVTEDVPLKDVLFELARQAKVDIEIDPRISGGIVFSAHKRPFLDVVDRICRLAGLAYSVDGNRVSIRLDEPYMATYEAPYLSQIRDTQSNVAVSTQVVTPGESASGDTASSSLIQGKSSADFFGEMEQALKSIMNSTAPRGLAQGNGDTPPVVVSRQTGIISVYGTSAQHKAVKNYLDATSSSAGAQVVIEAKVVEVALKDGFTSGIDWRSVIGNGTFNITAPLTTFATAATPTNLSTFTLAPNADFSSVLQLVEGFGTTRTLSSPRITVLNNQTAILKVANNEVFFEISVEREDVDNSNGGGNTTSRLNVDSTIKTIPIGLVMAVQPSIDLSSDQVTMTLRPTITRVTAFKDDPAVQFINSELPAGERVESKIPVVEVREVDSVMRMRSGEVGVMGGLMQETVTKDDQGIPGLMDAPIFGRAFKTSTDGTQTTELVVLLRATIVRQSRPATADQRLYQAYARDPRPFSFQQ